jgi:hypothetical protein
VDWTIPVETVPPHPPSYHRLSSTERLPVSHPIATGSSLPCVRLTEQMLMTWLSPSSNFSFNYRLKSKTNNYCDKISYFQLSALTKLRNRILNFINVSSTSAVRISSMIPLMVIEDRRWKRHVAWFLQQFSRMSLSWFKTHSEVTAGHMTLYSDLICIYCCSFNDTVTSWAYITSNG